MPLPEIYTIDQVAEHLKAGRGFVETEARRLGCYTEVGATHRMMFTPEQVTELLDEWRAKPARNRLAASTPEPTTPPDWRARRPFTADSLAAEWGCSAQHIRNLTRQGELKHFLVGRMIRIPFDAAEEFQRTHEVGRGGKAE